MGKSVHSDVLDGALDIIRSNATLMCLCSQQPTTRTEAVTTYSLGNVSVSSSDFTKAAGTVNGRKLTVAAKNVTVSAAGTMTHVALVDGSRLLYVSTCTPKALTTSTIANVQAWEAELSDPF